MESDDNNGGVNVENLSKQNLHQGRLDASEEQGLETQEIETPIISNRGPLKIPTPLELPQPSTLSENSSFYSLGQQELRTFNQQGSHKDDIVPATTAPIFSTEEDTNEAGTARFSSMQTDPIIMDKWPSKNERCFQEAKIPQTISVHKTDDSVIRGIPNYGQTCFMNSVLQSLASLATFEIYLDTQIRGNQRIQRSLLQPIFETQDKPSLLLVTQQLADGLRYINGCEATKKWDPRLLLRAVAESHKEFKKSYQQHDAQEFFGALVEVSVREQDSRQGLVQPVREGWNWRPSPPDNVVPATFCLSSAMPATVWALSSSFLQLRLPVLPIDETNYIEEDWNNAICNDDDTITIASATRQRAHNEQKGRKNTLLAVASIQNRSTTNYNKTGKPDISTEKCDNDVDGKCFASDLETPSSSSSSSGLPIAGEEKKQDEFELNIPRVNSEANMSDMSSSDVLQSPQSQTGNQNLSLSGTTSISTTKTRNSDLSMKRQRPSPPVRWSMPLEGWMGSTLQCRVCHHVKKIQNVSFVDISVVPTGVGNPYFLNKNGSDTHPCTVEECLAEFCRVERVENVECPSCTKLAHIAKIQEEFDFWQFALKDATHIQKQKLHQSEGSGELQTMKEELNHHHHLLKRWQKIDCDDDNCSKDIEKISVDEDHGKDPRRRVILRSDANKCLFLTRLPPVFCLHIQRRYYDPQTDRLCKTNQSVLFNEYLNLAPYCTYTAPSWVTGKPNGDQHQQRPHRQIMYRLTAVIEHCGGSNSGHYVCYRRSPSGGWLYVSDSIVRQVSWPTVQRCQAYMLFYENNDLLQSL